MSSTKLPRFARRTLIRSVDVEYVTLEDLQPGAVTVEGIVLERSVFDHTYTTPAGVFEVGTEAQGIAVLARVEPDMLDHTREVIAERAHRG